MNPKEKINPRDPVTTCGRKAMTRTKVKKMPVTAADRVKLTRLGLPMFQRRSVLDAGLARARLAA